MATISSRPIHSTAKATAEYIANIYKIIPPEDLHNVLNYMIGEHGLCRKYTIGINGCSSNIDLAVKQFDFYRGQYEAKHPNRRNQYNEVRYNLQDYLKAHKIDKADAKAVQRIIKSADAYDGENVIFRKKPVLAHHMFLSFPVNEHPSQSEFFEIIHDLFSDPLLKDFGAISCLHYNTDNLHAHILVSNYARDGSCTLSLKNKKMYLIRGALDKILYKHGLSIIDSSAVRYYCGPDYIKWLDNVIAEKKVQVIAENGASYNKAGWGREKAYKYYACIKDGATCFKVQSKQYVSTLDNAAHRSYYLPVIIVDGDYKYHLKPYIINIEHGTAISAKLAYGCEVIAAERSSARQNNNLQGDFDYDSELDRLLCAHRLAIKYRVNSIDDTHMLENDARLKINEAQQQVDEISNEINNPELIYSHIRDKKAKLQAVKKSLKKRLI